MSGASTAEARSWESAEDEEAPPDPGVGVDGGPHAAVPVAASTLVVGVGNPILGDDGAGWRVVEAVQRSAAPHDDVQFDCLAVGGLTLMERLVGVRRAILVDAVVTGADPPGTVRRLDLVSMPTREASHLDSAHDVTLAAALATGRTLGMALPGDVTVVTIEAAAVGEFREDLTPAVEAAIPEAVGAVLALLGAR